MGVRGYKAPPPPSPLAESTATADCIGMNVPPRRRVLLLLVFAALVLLATACDGLSESEWRRELEPLLPEEVTIVDSWTENCQVEPNCAVGFVLEHDRSSFVEDVAAFESAMVAEGWFKDGGGQDADSARVRLERKGIRVSLQLLSVSRHERCIESGGPDDNNCQSTLLVAQH